MKEDVVMDAAEEADSISSTYPTEFIDSYPT